MKRYLTLLVLASLLLVAGCTSGETITTAATPATTLEQTTTTTTARPSTTTETVLFPVGEATLIDPEGDVASPNGQKPFAGDPHRGDLVSVSITADTENLIVRFVNSAPPPANSGASSLGGDEYVFWFVQTVAEGAWQYQLSASLLGREWTASVYDFKAAPGAPSNTYVEAPIIDGKDIVVTFPLRRVVDLSAATHWWAGTEWSQGWDRYEDTAPDDGMETPAELVWND